MFHSVLLYDSEVVICSFYVAIPTFSLSFLHLSSVLLFWPVKRTRVRRRASMVSHFHADQHLLAEHVDDLDGHVSFPIGSGDLIGARNEIILFLWNVG